MSVDIQEVTADVTETLERSDLKDRAQSPADPAQIARLLRRTQQREAWLEDRVRA